MAWYYIKYNVRTIVTYEKYGGPYLPYVCQDGRGLMTGYGTFSPNLGKLTNKKNPNEIRIFMNENHEYIQTKRCNNLRKEI